MSGEIVGRDAELRTLGAFLDGLVAAPGALVLAGPAGRARQPCSARRRARGGARVHGAGDNSGPKRSAARLRGALRPGRALPGGRPPGSDQLTVTELRVAELVVRGMSNRQVAAELFVSVRAVESTLPRAYAKLGCRSRTELAARLLARPHCRTDPLAVGHLRPGVRSPRTTTGNKTGPRLA